MYKTGCSEDVSAMRNEETNPSMITRSSFLPAMLVELLQVGRSRARARACKGIRMVGGLGGGVASERSPSFVVGVAGVDGSVDVDA